MFQRTTDNMKGACGIMYGKMEKSLRLLRRIYFVEIIVLLIVGGIVGVFMSLYAAPNKSFVYQGRITGADFLPLDDATYYMRIKLFDATTGGTCQWSTGADRTGTNCAALNSAANVPVVLTRSLFSIPMGDTAYHANMPNIASLDFKNTTYFMDISFSTASAGTYELFTTRTKLGSAASAVTVLDALQANTSNQVPGTYTQINDADGITTGDTTITVDSTTGYPSAGTLLIDTEVMTYTATTATTFTGVVRGRLGTLETTHNDNATVKTYLFSGMDGTVVSSAALSADITSGGTTATVNSTSGYPTSGSLRIDNEIMSYSGTAATTFTGLTRGLRSTTAAAHTSGATVRLLPAPVFFITSDGSAFINTNSTTVNPQVGFQVSGTTRYTLGIDRIADSTANKFKISTNNVGATGTGTIASADVNITGTSTAFTTQLSLGGTITASGQTRTITSITSNTALTTDTAFSSPISPGTAFTFINTLLTLDSRNTFSAGAYSAFEFSGLNNTLASSFDADYTTLTVTPPTITLSGSTPVTTLMDSVFFGRPAIASIAAGIPGATTFTVAGPPLLAAGTMTNAYALKINTANTNGGAAPTNAYGLAVAAPTGATNNYSATFTGGNVGIGTTAPITQLHVRGNVPATTINATGTTSGAGSAAIDVQGRYAYVVNANANTLRIFDVSDLTVQTGTGTITNTGATVTGSGTAFTTQLAAGDTIMAGGQARVVASTPASAISLTTDSSFSPPFTSATSFTFLKSPKSISNPSSFTFTGTGTAITTNGSATVTGLNTSFTTQLTVGDTITVGAETRTISTISSDTSLTTTATFSTTNASPGIAFTFSASFNDPRSVVVRGRYAYVANLTGNRIFIIDVSNPAVPTGRGVINSSLPRNIAVQGRYAYVVSQGNTRLEVIDISNSILPTLTGTLALTQVPIGLFVQGRYVYLTKSEAPATGNNNRLQIIDVSNPASPAVPSGGTGLVATGQVANAVYVQGRYAYVTNDTSTQKFEVFDVKDPANPVSTGSITLTSTPMGVVVQGRFAYVTNYTGQTVQIFDVSDPTMPASSNLGASASLGGGVNYPAVQGRFLYVPNFDLGTLQVLDIGGSYIQQMEVGGLEAATGQIRNNLTVNNNLDVRGGINIGLGGMYSAGPLTVTGLEGNSGTNSALDVRNASGTNLLYVRNDNKIGIGVTSPTYDLSLSGSSTRFIAVEAAAAAAAGSGFIFHAGNGGSGTDILGGNLTLQSGNSTGTGQSKVVVQVPQRGVSGTGLNSAATMFEFVNGHVASVGYSGAGTIESSDVTVTGASTSFTTQLAVGNSIITSGQSRTITAIASAISLTIDSTFSPNLSPGTSFTIGGGVTGASCGSPGLGSNDASGKIPLTGAATACTLTFAKAFTNTPVCVAIFEDLVTDGSVGIRTSAISTTAATFTLNGTAHSGDKVSYFCIGLGTQL